MFTLNELASLSGSMRQSLVEILDGARASIVSAGKMFMSEFELAVDAPRTIAVASSLILHLSPQHNCAEVFLVLAQFRLDPSAPDNAGDPLTNSRCLVAAIKSQE